VVGEVRVVEESVSDWVCDFDKLNMVTALENVLTSSSRHSPTETPPHSTPIYKSFPSQHSNSEPPGTQAPGALLIPLKDIRNPHPVCQRSSSGNSAS
jgi:hypothetical protein